ncbi:protein lin-52-like, partial [Scleropages formosus]
DDFESSLLSFEKLDRASPDLWPEQREYTRWPKGLRRHISSRVLTLVYMSPVFFVSKVPGVAEFAASFKSPITNSPPKWMAELENDDIEMLKELGSLTTANLMEKVKGLQNLAYQLGLEE